MSLLKTTSVSHDPPVKIKTQIAVLISSSRKRGTIMRTMEIGTLKKGIPVPRN
jgi:hypothetical protein